MAPLLGVFLFGILLILAALVFLIIAITGLFFLIKGIRSKSHILKITGGMLLIVLLAIVLFFLWPKSLKSQAANLMVLPPKAEIVRVRFGDWSGDGEVEFKLPSNHPVNKWLNIIWKMNLPDEDDLKDSGTETHSSTYSRSITYSGNDQELSYNPATHLYLYKVVLNS